MLFLPFYLLFQENCLMQPSDFSAQLCIRKEVKTEILERESLFLRGKACQQDHDYGEAVRHFTKLIVKYPDPVFLSLKTYDRLLDVYAMMNEDFKLSRDDKDFMMEVLTNPSNFEDQLLLAREIYLHGFDEVSWATFTIGITHTKMWLSKNRDTYLAFKTLWHIGRYADDLEQYDLLEQSAKKLLLLTEQLIHCPLKSSRQKKINKIKRQTYLWLVKIYNIKKDIIQEKKFIERLVSEFPDFQNAHYKA